MSEIRNTTNDTSMVRGVQAPVKVGTLAASIINVLALEHYLVEVENNNVVLKHADDPLTVLVRAESIDGLVSLLCVMGAWSTAEDRGA